MIPAYINLLGWTIVLSYLNNTRALLPVFVTAIICTLTAAVIILRCHKLTRRVNHG